MKHFWHESREKVSLKARRRELINLVALDKRHSVFSEFWESQREGDGFDVARIRAFDPQDDPEDLDIDSIASGEKDVVVRQAMEGMVLMIFADISSSLTYYPRHPEYSKGLIRDIAMSLLVNSAYQMMSPVGLVLFSDRVENVFRPQSGEYAFYALQKFLSEEPRIEGVGTSLACIERYIHEFQEAMICLVSDFKDADIEHSWIRQLGPSRLDLVPIVIRDPLKQAGFPHGAQFLCSDPETGRKTRCYVGAKEFAEIMLAEERYYEKVRAILRGLQLAHVELDSADFDTCHQALKHFFAQKFALI